MDIFEFAMKMELDGKAFYEKMASQSENAALKNILHDLAQDEVKHYNIFKRFRDGDFSAASEMQTSSKVFQRAKNVFESIAAKPEFKEFSGDVVNTWKKAQEIEKKSEDFYRQKASAAENEKAKKTIMLIADEEHKHWALIENVLQFLQRPKQWLEDAEWNNLDKY